MDWALHFDNLNAEECVNKFYEILYKICDNNILTPKTLQI